MKTGKKKTIWVAAFVVVLTLAALLGVFLALNRSRVNSPGGSHALQEMPKATASDEETLRKLLLEESERTIEVNKDVEIDEQLIVKGKKTLTGTGELRMALHAEWGQALLVVSKGTSLTMDGPMLNGNYVSDGIHMEADGELTYLSGTIKASDSYGIQAQGEVSIRDVNIEWAEYIAIFAQKGSKVKITGGTLKNTATDDIYVEKGASVDISGHPTLEGCMGDAIVNYGTLNVHGGTFRDVNSYVFNNYGELHADDQGKDGGQIECTNARLGVFCTRKSAKTSISGVYVHDTVRQGVVTVGGKTEISDSTFERTGYHSIEIQTGKAAIENVTVRDSKNAALESYTDAEVSIKGFTVEGCAGIGISSRGAKITGSDIQITGALKYGISCGNSKNGKASAKISDAVVTDPERSGFYVYDGANMELENVQVSGSKSRGIYIGEGASCTLSGNSIVRDNVYRGIEARGKFVMNDGQVYGNKVENSGAGVYVSEAGDFTMNGGSIYDNVSGLRGGGICVTDGKVTINKGDVYNNASANNGGGLYAQKKAVVTLKSGSIRNNRSDLYGDGIHIASAATKVTVGDQFYLGGNDVKIDNVGTALQITGSGLSRHSASDPLLLTPNYDAKEGTVVASCRSAGVAGSLAVKVRAGDGSYNIVRNSQNFVITYATADMDMTGADTVAVSNFQELKDAALKNTAKRYVVLKEDIAMEERLRLPGGTTLCVKDDGTKRTLTRANGFTDNLFVTHYGTGLYLEATKAGNLVIDGSASAGVEGSRLQPLVRTAGSTVLNGVVLQNNGSLDKDSQVRGALMRQLYGDFKIYDSVLRGGLCSSGGAVMLDKGTGYVKDSAFTENQSVIGGGAIRAAANTQLAVEDSVFTGNHAGTTGGAIVAVSGARVTVTDTTFADNTAKNFGGALSVQDEGTVCVLKGTDPGAAVFENNQAKTIGAVCVQTKAQLTVSGYIFENNAATAGRAGAMAVNSGASALLENTGFYKNRASGSGGAVSVADSAVRVQSCEFGKENAGNIAGDKGGAILVTGTGSAILDAAEGGTYNRMAYNQAVIGGAICLYNGGEATIRHYTLEGNSAVADSGATGGVIYAARGSDVTVENCTFTKNKASNGGGAIHILPGGTVTVSQSVFSGNSTTNSDNGNGGAIYCQGTYHDSNSSYTGNTSARHGGAVIVQNGAQATLEGTDGNAKFSNNRANASANGNAVYVNSGAVVSITGYEFDDDTQKVFAAGTLTFGNITGATLVQGKSGKLNVAGEVKEVTVTPGAYTEGRTVLTKAEGVTEEVFQAVCAGIRVTSDSNGKAWFIDGEGKLQRAYAARIDDTKYDTFAAAIDQANQSGGTGEAADIVVYVRGDVELGNKGITISKNIKIQNEPGSDAVIRRSGNIVMFTVSSGAKFTLGTNEKVTGRLVVDGATASAVSSRMVQNPAGATFILGRNAVLQNANVNNWGTALNNAGTAELYGSVINNTSTAAGGAILQSTNAEAKLTIHGGNYTGNKATRSASHKNGVSQGSAIIVSAGTVEIQGGVFSDNTTTGAGGAIYVYNATTVTISGGTFEGNEAGTNGNAIYIAGGGKVTITGGSFETAAPAQEIYVDGTLEYSKELDDLITLIKKSDSGKVTKK